MHNQMIGNQIGKGRIVTEECKKKIGDANRGSNNRISKLDDEKVKCIKNIFVEKNDERLAGQNNFFAKIGAEYGVSGQAIADIWYGRTWAHIT